MNDELQDTPAGEFLLYTTEDGKSRVECRFENETLWLSQALMAEHPRPLAQSIFEALKTKPPQRARLNKGLTYALLNSESFSDSIALSKIIELCNDFTPADKQILWEACHTNNQVYHAHKVTEKVYGLIGEPPVPA